VESCYSIGWYCGGHQSKRNRFVLQSILGLCAFSQSVPRSILCRPVFVMATSMFSQYLAPIPICSMVAWRLSLFVQCSINISWVHRAIYVISWESVFSDKACIIVDTFCFTVQNSFGVDFFPVVQDSNIYLHRRTSYISNCIWWYIGRLRWSEHSDSTRSTTGYWYNSLRQCS